MYAFLCSPSNSRYFNFLNKDIFDILDDMLCKYSAKGDICIIGDLNARCGTRKDYSEDYSVLDHYFEESIRVRCQMRMSRGTI